MSNGPGAQCNTDFCMPNPNILPPSGPTRERIGGALQIIGVLGALAGAGRGGAPEEVAPEGGGAPGRVGATRANAGAGMPEELAALAKSGARDDTEGLSRAGRSFDKHAEEGNFPPRRGNAETKNDIGQQQLEDILTNENTQIRMRLAGNQAGGSEWIAPDGRAAIFGRTGEFEFFGVIRP
jgi:hypothetical protein